MSEKLVANPAGMQWCPTHKAWEYENDTHTEVPESAPEYKAHIAVLIKMLPGNGGDAKCRECGRGADVVTDGLYTKFYCSFHWDHIDAGDWMERAQRDPLTDEEKETFGIEEVK